MFLFQDKRGKILSRVIAVLVIQSFLFVNSGLASDNNTLAPDRTRSRTVVAQVAAELEQRDKGREGGTAVTSAGALVGLHRGEGSVNEQIVRRLLECVEHKDFLNQRGITEDEVDRFKNAVRRLQNEGRSLDTIIPQQDMLPIDKLEAQNVRIMVRGGNELRVVYLPVNELATITLKNGETIAVTGHPGLREGVLWIAAGPKIEKDEIELITAHEKNEYTIAYDVLTSEEEASKRGLKKMKNMAEVAKWRDEASAEAQVFFHWAHEEAWRRIVDGLMQDIRRAASVLNRPIRDDSRIIQECQEIITSLEPSAGDFKPNWAEAFNRINRAMPKFRKAVYYLREAEAISREFVKSEGRGLAITSSGPADADRASERQLQARYPGVVFINPSSIIVGRGVTIGTGTVVYPGVEIRGNSRVGENCQIMPGTRIENSTLDSGVEVADSSISGGRISEGVNLTKSEVGDSYIGEGTKAVGATLRNSRVGARSNLRFGLVAENAEIGDDTNVGSRFRGKAKTDVVMVGDGVVSEHNSAQIIGAANFPNTFPIVHANWQDGELHDIPNLTNIGAGTTIDGSPTLHTAFTTINSRIEGDVIVNFAGFVKGHIREQDIPEVLPFSFVQGFGAERKPVHRIAWLLLPEEEGGKPGILANFIKKTQRLLPDGRKSDIYRLIQGSIRLGIRRVKDERAKLKRGESSIYTEDELNEGLRIYQAALEDSRWQIPEEKPVKPRPAKLEAVEEKPAPIAPRTLADLIEERGGRYLGEHWPGVTFEDPSSTIVDGTVTIGKGTVILSNTILQGDATVGANCRIIDSTVVNSSVRDNVQIENSIVGTSKTTEDWAFIEEETAEREPEHSLRRFRVKVARTVLSNDVHLKDMLVTNSEIGSGTTAESAQIMHSQIGMNNKILPGGNVEKSETAESCQITGEVSKSWLGPGFVSDSRQTYVSFVTPDEYPIVDEGGNLTVLAGLPNPVEVPEGGIWANFGGELAPSGRSSLKGTAFGFAAFLEPGTNIINLYGHPDVGIVDLPFEKEVTTLLPFCRVAGEVWGVILPGTEAHTLSPKQHRIGIVFDEDPTAIREMVNRIVELLPETEKHRADGLVEGVLRLGIQLVRREISSGKSRYTPEQLQEGLAIYERHLQSGQWRMRNGRRLTGIRREKNYQSLLEVFAQDRKLLDELVARAAEARGCSEKELLQGSINPNNPVDIPTFDRVARERQRRPSQAVLIGGGNAISSVIPAYRKLGKNVAGITTSFDRGGDTGRLWRKMKPVFGNTVPAGDYTNFLSAGLSLPKRNLLLQRLPKRVPANATFKSLLIKTIQQRLNEPIGEEGRLIDEPDLVPFLVELFNLAEVVDRHRVKGVAKFGLSGRSIKNLLLPAIQFYTGGYTTAGIVEEQFQVGTYMLQEALGIDALHVSPVSLEEAELRVDFEPLVGEKNIGDQVLPAKIVDFEFEGVKRGGSRPKASRETMRLLTSPDTEMIVIGPGSFYTSILPNLACDGVIEALILRVDIPKVFIMNIDVEYEVNRHTVEDFITRVESLASRIMGRKVEFTEIVSDVIINDSSRVSQELKDLLDRHKGPLTATPKELEKLRSRLGRNHVFFGPYASIQRILQSGAGRTAYEDIPAYDLEKLKGIFEAILGRQNRVTELLKNSEGKIVGTDGTRGEYFGSRQEAIQTLQVRDKLKKGDEGMRCAELLANYGTLTPELAYLHGQAYALTFGIDRPFLLGGDNRPSTKPLMKAFVEGLEFQGGSAHIIDEIITTPALAAEGRRRKYRAVGFTGSHLPWNENGIKGFTPDGQKFSDEETLKLERNTYLIAEGLVVPKVVPSGEISYIEGTDEAYRQYLGSMRKKFEREFGKQPLTGRTVVLDTANGAATQIAPYFFKSLGAEVVQINASTDGRLGDAPKGSIVNYHDEEGWVDDKGEPLMSGAQNTTRLSFIVKQLRTQGRNVIAGFGFDGDADRVMAVDENGVEVDGDGILGAIALCLKNKGKLAKDTVVVTTMATMGLMQAMEEAGITVRRTKVGDRYISDVLIAEGLDIGGEQSGHTIYRKLQTTGDGVAIGAFLLCLAVEEGVPLSQFTTDKISREYPYIKGGLKADTPAQGNEFIARLGEERRYDPEQNQFYKQIMEAIEKGFVKVAKVADDFKVATTKAVDYVGVNELYVELKKEGKNVGWVSFRQSGTEPRTLRIYLAATRDPEIAESVHKELLRLSKEELARIAEEPAAAAPSPTQSKATLTSGTSTGLGSPAKLATEVKDIEGSGMELAESVEGRRRLQFAYFHLHTTEPPLIDEARLAELVADRSEDCIKMRDEMRYILSRICSRDDTDFRRALDRMTVEELIEFYGVGPFEEEEMSEEGFKEDLIQTLAQIPVTEIPIGGLVQIFARVAAEKIRRVTEPLAKKYNLDEHALIALEWGSRRPAHFRQKGTWRHKVTLNIHLLLNDTVLEGEALHEFLHPLVRSWFEYFHIQYPGLFRAAEINVEPAIVEPVEEGYIANIWQWEFQRDNIALLREAIEALRSSEDYEMRTEASRREYAAGQILDKAIKALNNSTDEESRKKDKDITDEIRKGPRQRETDLEFKERLLRAAKDAVDTSEDPRTRDFGRQRSLGRMLDRALIDTLRIMKKPSAPPDIYEKASDIENTRKASDLMATLAEVFILKKELEFLEEKDSKDAQGGEETVIEVLESADNILDVKEKDETGEGRHSYGRLAELLRLSGDRRLEGIIEHTYNTNVYRSMPGLTRGAKILNRLWRSSPGLIQHVLEELDERLAELEAIDLEPPRDMDGVARLLDVYGVELLKVNFTDPTEKRFVGLEKSVLAPISSTTRRSLEEGIGFDGSSIISLRTGKTVAEIFASDFGSRIIPSSLRIFRSRRRGRVRASIDAEVLSPEGIKRLKENGELERQKIRGEYSIFNPEKVVHVDRNLAPAMANQEAIRVLRNYGLREVKLLLSDWTEELTMVPIKVDHLETAFEGGVELSENQAKYLPTTLESKKGFKAVPDPYSLSVIEYADGRIEAVMAVEIRDPDGNIFDGDFRTKLKETMERAKVQGFIPYMSPEPEVYFFRRLKDGSLVTADISCYYDDIDRLPLDVQELFEDIIVAARSAGILVMYIHTEVGPGQAEKPYEHGPALDSADKTVLYMYIVKKIAQEHGFQACFMPKPVKGVSGSGMHIHQSLMAVHDDTQLNGWKYNEGDNVFYDPRTGEEGSFLSQTAQHYISGLLKYAPGILRITNPSRNSYRRIVPHAEAPIALVAGRRNRSSAVRFPEYDVPVGGANAPAARIEYRVPDPCGNIHAKFWTVLEAGLQGIEEGRRGEMEPLVILEEESVYDMSAERKAELGIVELPGGENGLDEAIALMNSPEMAPLMDRLIPPNSDLRKFLTQTTYLLGIPGETPVQQMKDAQEHPGQPLGGRGLGNIAGDLVDNVTNRGVSVEEAVRNAITALATDYLEERIGHENDPDFTPHSTLANLARVISEMNISAEVKASLLRQLNSDQTRTAFETSIGEPTAEDIFEAAVVATRSLSNAGLEFNPDNIKNAVILDCAYPDAARILSILALRSPEGTPIAVVVQKEEDAKWLRKNPIRNVIAVSIERYGSFEAAVEQARIELNNLIVRILNVTDVQILLYTLRRIQEVAGVRAVHLSKGSLSVIITSMGITAGNPKKLTEALDALEAVFGLL